MANVILIIKTVAELIPAIISIIKALEDAMPESGKGKEKLDVLKSTLESAYAAEQRAEVSFDAVWPTVQAIVTKLVAVYNAIGTFKKSV